MITKVHMMLIRWKKKKMAVLMMKICLKAQEKEKETWKQEFKGMTNK